MNRQSRIQLHLQCWSGLATERPSFCFFLVSNSKSYILFRNQSTYMCCIKTMPVSSIYSQMPHFNNPDIGQLLFGLFQMQNKDMLHLSIDESIRHLATWIRIWGANKCGRDKTRHFSINSIKLVSRAAPSYNSIRLMFQNWALGELHWCCFKIHFWFMNKTSTWVCCTMYVNLHLLTSAQAFPVLYPCIQQPGLARETKLQLQFNQSNPRGPLIPMSAKALLTLL